jgi:hypothetical protein
MNLPPPTKEQIKSHGMCFTPDSLVNEMLDKLPPEVFTDKNKTFLDNSAGRGAFLYQVMKRKIMSLQGKMILAQAHKQALKTIYGVELDSVNAEECRQRLLNGSQSKELRNIINNNIICADALDWKHKGWKSVGFYWDKDFQPPQKEVKVKETISNAPIKLASPVRYNDFLNDLEEQIAHGETW